jgi:hypothetical protein
LWMGIWQHIHTVATTDVSPDLGKFSEIIYGVNVELIPLREAVEPFKLHPTSMSYIYKVFQHLKQLWMGIWQHIHTVTTTDVSPDLGKFSEIIYGVNVELIPLRYRWGCRTFQTASHIYVIHIRCLITLNSCGWAYDSTFTPLQPQTFPQIWESLLKS